MIDLLVRILINAIAVYVAVLVVPQIHFPAADNLLKLQGNWWQVVVVALILALINAYVKPIVKALSFPITLLTLGLFSLVISACMLLVTAWLMDTLHVDGFGPAFVGAIVIAIVTLVLDIVLRPVTRTVDVA